MLAQSPDGEPITTAADALDARELRLRFADGPLAARVLGR